MIYINKDALLSIEREINDNPYVETGGILLGFNMEERAIITHAIPAKGKSIKKPFFFKNDIKYSRKMEGIHYKKYGVHYLGDWHKHPNNDTNASIIDRFSILKTTLINSKNTFFIIVGNDFTLSNKQLKVHSLNKMNYIYEEHEYCISEQIEYLINMNKGNLY